MRGVVISAMVVVAGAMAAAQSQQPIEIDRTLEHIYGTAITTSDLREARLLKLVPEAAVSDGDVQRALENRLLIMHEMTRAQAVDPGRDAVAARRNAARPIRTFTDGSVRTCRLPRFWTRNSASRGIRPATRS